MKIWCKWKAPKRRKQRVVTKEALLKKMGIKCLFCEIIVVNKAEVA